MIEYERALIGWLLTDENVIYQTKVHPEHFQDALCRQVYTAINDNIADGVTPSIVTVTAHDEALRQRASEVAKLTTEAAISNLSFYEDKILSGYRTRRLSTLAKEIDELKDAPEDAIAAIEEELQILTAEYDADRVYSSRELVRPLIEYIEERYKAHGQLAGISCGIRSIDSVINGLQPRRLYYIGARPSQGKSAMLLNMAGHIAVTENLPVGIISAESSKEELMLREMANTASINSERLNSGMLKPTDFTDITRAGEWLHDAPLYFYDVPNVGITRLVSVARMMRRRYGIRALFIDYVQIIEPDIKRENFASELKHVSMQLKSISRRLAIPVIAAAQLRRDADTRKPLLSDFADSSQIEKDSDVSILIQHDADNPGRVWAHIDKNRDGRTATVPLQFRGEFVRFTDEVRQDL